MFACLCLCLGVVLFRFWEDTWLFAFHLFLYNMRIADRPQDVLMTVRASSVHGMSQKKKQRRKVLADVGDDSMRGGLVGTRSQKEKSGSLPTGLIGLEMI